MLKAGLSIARAIAEAKRTSTALYLIGTSCPNMCVVAFSSYDKKDNQCQNACIHQARWVVALIPA